ncbi:MAG: hypothetical protein M1827_001260 [Pycnora praestabilis]|nr:MAG: hypothetical protein M1827_001260 [Pycnora praestabilis]
MADNEILKRVAEDGHMDYKEWPGLLERLLPRLDHITYNDFQTPLIPLPISPRVLPHDQSSAIQREASPSQESTSQSSQTTNEENAPPLSPPSRPPVPAFSASTTEQQNLVTESSTIRPPEGTLPPQLLSLLSSIKDTLQATFFTAPPHTIQRLAELILRPTAHYRSLPSFLRALDRVLSVSSGADVFPLPNAALPSPPSDSSGVLNGTNNPYGTPTSMSNLGSDESLGGALLTPIPWLRDQQGEVRTESTETIDGPNGAGSVETVSISLNGVASPSLPSQLGESSMRSAGAVTQGELLRQEQQAGVVPVAQGSTTRQTRSATARGLAEANEGEEEEHPHARGPDEMTMEDMGPQESATKKGGFDVEAALGRSVPKIDDKGNDDGKEADGSSEQEDDKNKGIVLADADGKTEGDGLKADNSGENVGADAVDTTMQ